MNDASFVMRGINMDINILNYNSSVTLSIFDEDVKNVNIGTININETHVNIIGIQSVESPVINIGNIYDNINDPDYHWNITVSVIDISNMPMINIYGTVDMIIDYWFIDTTYMVSTDIDGNIVSRYEYVIDFALYEDNVVLNAPNLDMANFNFRCIDVFITELFVKNREW